jgi:hypothetical protein
VYTPSTLYPSLEKRQERVVWLHGGHTKAPQGLSLLPA